jgi:hypothetical protein
MVDHLTAQWEPRDRALFHRTWRRRHHRIMPSIRLAS